MQWFASHVSLEGKEIADKLATKGTTLLTKETPTHTDSLNKLLNRKIAMKYKPEAGQALYNKEMRDIHQTWAEYKGNRRKEVVANFRLKTKHDYLAAHLRKIGIH
jgi:hypothetical protein